ncbi:hypothetical protein BDZ97DRAFT_1850735 [Flammula alnicola]|nr:hypothetical protein BDZ97DRAFT_1850735 [Flammula alnicola]
MFDVNNPETMLSLKKWWADFCDRAPLADEDMNDYCCVVVGNKIDMVGKGQSIVSESEALEFLDELVPPALSSSSSSDSPSSDINVLPPAISIGSPEIPPQKPNEPFGGHSPKHHLSKSRSRSSSRFYAGTHTTTHTTLTIYHTPSSSLFDVYQSARSSPEPWLAPEQPPSSLPGGSSARQRTVTMLSTGSTSSGSAVTITPSLFARETATARATSPPSVASAVEGHALHMPTPPLPPERGPKLFFTSAKMGEGVNDVFEYIARRVVRKWEYDEWASGGGDTIRLQGEGWRRRKVMNDCCSS